MSQISPATAPMDAATAEVSSYKHQCAALGVKANSRLTRYESALLDQTRLDFSLNFIGGAGLQAITDAIAHNTVLDTLIISSNGLSNEAIVFLCRAIRAHPTLRVLDLSNNPISLPAGLALIDLVKSNPVIREVRLQSTLIDDAVQGKIRRLLNIARAKRERSDQVAASQAAASQTGTGAPVLTPFQKAVAEHHAKVSKRKAEEAARKQGLEASSPVGVVEELKSSHIPIPLRAADGWAVVQLYVSTAPTGFTTELRLIHDSVVPKLNKIFAARKIHVVPFAMYHGVPPLAKEKAKVAPPRLAILADYQEAILKSTPLFVQLVGDKVGLSEFVSAPSQAAAAAAKNQNAEKAAPSGHLKTLAIPHRTATGERILSREFEMASEQAVRLVFRRAPAVSLHVPEGLMASVTDDPHIVHPDPLTYAVKTAVAKAQGVPMPRPASAFDFDVAERLWKQHNSYYAALSTKLPRPFIVDYRASYSHVDGLGQIQLKDLEDFEASLMRRLTAAIDFMYPLPSDIGTVDVAGNASLSAAALASKLHASEKLAAAVERSFLQFAVVSAVGRKNIGGKLDLYTVTPPSRNMALVTCTPGCGGTSVIAAYTVRCLQKQSYITASHFARNPWLVEEPTDLRSVLLHLARQLSKDGKLPTHIESEVDIIKIKAYFNTCLANTSGDAGESKTVVVSLDGIDDIDPSILPCRSLRVSDTGADAWDPPLAPASIQPPLPAVTHRQIDTFDWIPICLSRNVRFVVTAQRGSEVHQTLEMRGHDSCDAIPVGDIGDNDIETIVMRECEAIGISLRDEEVAIIRSKADARVPEYLAFVTDHLRQRDEASVYTTRLTALSQLPPTLDGMCQALLDAMEADFGVATARAVITLLLASRWGLLECELRTLLRLQKQQTVEAGAHAAAIDASAPLELLNGELFQRVLRRLRPVIDQHAEVLARTQIPCNGLHLIVHIRSRAFRAAATSRYMNRANALAAHHQLAHHYKRLMSAPGPLESKAVREYPFHVIKGEMWSLLETTVAALQFISQSYLLRLGYQALRELIRAYNTLDDVLTSREEAVARSTASKGSAKVASQAAANEVGASLSNQTIAALQLKLREYIYFVRDHNINLVQYPHMVRQIAITCPPESCLQADARDFFRQLEQQPHFVVMNRTRAKLHRDRIADCAFAPTGLRIATCSDDRSIKVCNLTGDGVIHINQSVSKVQKICYSQTSRYLAAICEDRSLIVADATNGSVVSRPIGHTTTVRCVALSSRGRFLFTGGEDRYLKVWDTETGTELFAVSHVSFSHHTSPHGAVTQILTHPFNEDIFYSVSDKKFFGWKVKSSALSDADQLLCIVGHSTLPLGSCQLAGEGMYAVTCARELALPQPHALRTEDNVKLWSLVSGRCIATLALGVRGNLPGHIATTLAPDEKTLAAATFDGGLDLYRLDWRSYAPSDAEDAQPIIVTPSRRLAAFKEHPTPKLLFARFSFDSKYVAAVGNLRQLKVWSTETQSQLAQRAESAEATANPSESSVASGSLLTALSAADHTVAEFLMDQPASCMDWTVNPADDGGELVVGDTVGKLYALKLKR